LFRFTFILSKLVRIYIVKVVVLFI